MAKRRRRGTEPGEFHDPLRNYDPPVYEDSLEKALGAGTMADIQAQPFLTLPSHLTVAQAIKAMVEIDVACAMIVEGDKLVGMFSERDVLNKIAEKYEQVKDKPVHEFMTADPIVAYETDSPAHAINLMAFGGFRHVPVLDVDDRPAGIVGPSRMTAYLQKIAESAG